MSGRVLCVDCGNTRLKWGMRAAGRWLTQEALPVAAIEQLDNALAQKPARLVACNVAGDAIGRHIEALAAAHSIPLSWVRSQARQCGVTNRYEDFRQLGSDRWAALVGARSLHGGACLVITAGTATTIDVLDAAGEFRGGLILPGLRLMHRALADNTAGLPYAVGVFRDLPRNTGDAIASGGLQATLGAMERMFRQLDPTADPSCLLSGGAAAELEPLLALPLRRVENLVLEGLAVIVETADA